MHMQSVIPVGYRFVSPHILMSERALPYFEKGAEAFQNCDPDNFDLYIYNDFHAYGQLDVVDKALRFIHDKIERKDWEGAFVYLEALIQLNNACGSWPMADDGDRVLKTDKLFGACLLKVLRALKDDDKLNVETFPNLETILKGGATWGDSAADAKYQIVLRGIGKRLFTGKSAPVIAREKAMVEEWVSTLSKKDQKYLREQMEEEAEEEDPDAGPWFDQGKANEDFEHHSFKLAKVWKEYTTYLRTVPSVPLRGPPKWDLTKWTAAEKASFQMDSDIDDDFF